MIHVSELDPDDDDYKCPFVPRKVTVKRKDPKDEYRLGEELGRGKFGVVYCCSEKKTAKKLAAKFIIIKDKVDRENVEREVSIMCMLQNPLILQLYDAFDDGSSQMCMVMELIEGGELFERVICDDFILTERACSIFMKQICEAIEYVHSKQIVHLDMKPENVLVLSKAGNRIKIIDFGLARKLKTGEKLQVLFGTAEFVSPEVINFESVSYSADMWSLGVICYVLLSGLSPFMGDNDLQTMGNVTSGEYDFDDEAFDVITNEAKDFICKLLVRTPGQRLTPSQALEHYWINPRKRKSVLSLDKRKLKRFVIKRRWQKAINAIMALRRLGAKF